MKRGLVCATLLLAALCACITPAAQSGIEEQSSRRRLADLALVNDDTIVTRSARTVNFNGQSLVPRYAFTSLGKGDRHLTVQAATVRAVIGLDPDVTVGIALPYLDKRLRRTNPSSGQRETLRSGGVGDLTLLGKYRFYQNTDIAETTEAAAIFGLELPTGRTNVRDSGMRLAQPLQPGSGSVDVVVGGALTRVDGRLLVNTDLLGKFNTRGDGYRFGNSYRFDIGGQFRLWPVRYENFEDMTVNLILELNTVYTERDRFRGSTQLDTGGVKVFLTPGLQTIVSESLLFEGAVQVPLFEDLHGAALEESFRVIVGLRARF